MDMLVHFVVLWMAQKRYLRSKAGVTCKPPEETVGELAVPQLLQRIASRVITDLGVHYSHGT